MAPNEEAYRPIAIFSPVHCCRFTQLCLVVECGSFKTDRQRSDASEANLLTLSRRSAWFQKSTRLTISSQANLNCSHRDGSSCTRANASRVIPFCWLGKEFFVTALPFIGQHKMTFYNVTENRAITTKCAGGEQVISRRKYQIIFTGWGRGGRVDAPAGKIGVTRRVCRNHAPNLL